MTLETNSVSDSRRRLASVLAADVVGYTRIMEVDELGTHTRLMALRELVVLPEIARHQGKLVKNTGDGFLAMFDSARAATECGIAIQRGVLAREVEIVADRRINFRIGVNVCEVIVEDHDIYGDGVNVAARLQAYAEPAGLAVSGAVAELAGEFDGVTMTDLGQQQMRNLQHPVRVISLRLKEAPPVTAGDAFPGEEARPSIAVLPFRPGSSNLESYFTDGVVDNIVHALAALKELFVISRGSTLGFRGPSPDLRAIGQELGVRYILHGSVQRAGDRLRISTELADVEAGDVVRTDRHDGSVADLFDLQDQIAVDVVKSIAPHVRERELKRAMRKRPQDMTAFDLVLQALGPLYRLDYATFSRARGLLQRAMVVDPGYAPAYSYAAWWHSARIGQVWSNDPIADAREAVRLAESALDRDPSDALALAVYGHQRAYVRKEYEAAIEYLDAAIAACPNLAIAWTLKGLTLCFIGEGAKALEHARHGVRLSPNDQNIGFAEHIVAQAHYIVGDFEQAVVWSRRAVAHNDRQGSTLRTLISSLVAIGDLEAAQTVALRHREIAPRFRIRDWADRSPMSSGFVRARIDRLRRAGLPD